MDADDVYKINKEGNRVRLKWVKSKNVMYRTGGTRQGNEV